MQWHKVGFEMATVRQNPAHGRNTFRFMAQRIQKIFSILTPNTILFDKMIENLFRHEQ